MTKKQQLPKLRCYVCGDVIVGYEEIYRKDAKGNPVTVCTIKCLFSLEESEI